MGIIATTRVVTGSEKNLRPNLIQPGNREWVTVIEGVNASGWFLPPMFILKGKNHLACQVKVICALSTDVTLADVILVLSVFVQVGQEFVLSG